MWLLTFDEMSMNSSLNAHTGMSAYHTGMSAVDSSRSDNSSPTDGTRFKATANNIRQSLAVLMNARAGSDSAVPNLCSGTINGRGSFAKEHAVERQQRFNRIDCLERVLQDSTRIRRLYHFLKKQQCPELLEFWSIVELYQNLYWKPFKLMGINLHIQVKRNPELDGEEEDKMEETTGTHANKKERTQSTEEGRGSIIRHATLAKVLTNFTLEQEETLRSEIIKYYMEDDAPLQICLPSQVKEKTLKTALRALELPDEDRLSMVSNMWWHADFYCCELGFCLFARVILFLTFLLFFYFFFALRTKFREAQKFCYDELQRIHMPLFIQYEQSTAEDDAVDVDTRTEFPPYSPALAAATSELAA